MAESNRPGEDAADDDLDGAVDTKPDSGAKESKSVPTKKKAKKDSGPNIFGRFLRFVREIVAELRKVIWPTRKELVTYTSVVVVFVAVMLTIVAGLDVGFAKVMILVFGSPAGADAGADAVPQ